MTIPGSNLLSMALTAVFPQNISWYAANGRTLNAVGQYITTYNAPVMIRGSFQPVSRQVKLEMGLDWQKSYYLFYTPNDLTDVERDVSPDLLVQGSDVYQVESDTDWFSDDGWRGSLVCLSGLPVPTFKNGNYIIIE